MTDTTDSRQAAPRGGRRYFPRDNPPVNPKHDGVPLKTRVPDECMEDPCMLSVTLDIANVGVLYEPVLDSQGRATGMVRELCRISVTEAQSGKGRSRMQLLIPRSIKFDRQPLLSQSPVTARDCSETSIKAKNGHTHGQGQYS